MINYADNLIANAEILVGKREIKVQNPDDASDERTERDYDPIDLMPTEDLEDSRNL